MPYPSAIRPSPPGVCLTHLPGSLHFVATVAVWLASVLLVACTSGSGDSSAATTAPVIVAADSFLEGIGRWKVEQQDAAGTVTASAGVLDIMQPSGATLWFKQRLSGDYQVQFTATPIPLTVGIYTDRISDLNVFWNATVPTGADPNPTLQNFDGALGSYSPLTLYYVGFGANNNTTTRLRRYDGTDARPQITGYAAPAVTTAEDKAGPMTAATSLTANAPTRVRIVSRAATADEPLTLKWYANDALIFAYADPAPYLAGWFALRTTASHLQIRDFSVVRL